MRHRIFGRQLSRDTEHRTAMRRNLVQSLFEHGMVRTTLPKAQEVRGMAEKLITMARTGTLAARRRVIATLQDRRLVDEDQEFITEGSKTVVQKLFNDIAPRFADRRGGYTRIIKTSDFRIGDGGNIVVLQLLTEESKPAGGARRSAGLRRRRNERRHQFATRALKGAQTEKQAAPAAEPEAPAQAESSEPS